MTIMTTLHTLRTNRILEEPQTSSNVAYARITYRVTRQFIFALLSIAFLEHGFHIYYLHTCLVRTMYHSNEKKILGFGILRLKCVVLLLYLHPKRIPTT